MPKFREFNFFIGANNSGKSAILNFISSWLPLAQGPRILAPLETHASGGPVEVGFCIPADELLNHALGLIPEAGRSGVSNCIRMMIDVIAVEGVVWLKAEIPFKGEFSYLYDVDHDLITKLFQQHDWSTIERIFLRSRGGNWDQLSPVVMQKIKSGLSLSTPNTLLIPAIRQIGPTGQPMDDFSGKGVIDLLAAMQNPRLEELSKSILFSKVNTFIQDVTGNKSASIQIPHNREHILVNFNGRILPLESLGTGIHEVVILAAYCTTNSEMIVCIEEPEIHLHPVLQRKLIKYLANSTNNQYFIATHSASFIDTPGAAIFHVSSDGNQTTVRETILRSEKYEICVELGCKASDIVQSNCVIWVEGPSDRIYIKHWIAELDPTLVEGIHYSIMFYGGRLLSHLSADDADVTEFISLLSLNRNCAIVIDSDKSKVRDSLNATKLRIIKEFKLGNGFSWVTRGREIENYVAHERLQAAVKATNPTMYLAPLSGGLYDHALYFTRSVKPGKGNQTKTSTNADKVKVAKIVCETRADLNVLDLRSRVSALVAMIRSANE